MQSAPYTIHCTTWRTPSASNPSICAIFGSSTSVWVSASFSVPHGSGLCRPTWVAPIHQLHVRYLGLKLTLLSLHSSFTQNGKHCSSTNPILIHPLLLPAEPVSTSNTIRHSHLNVCLPDSGSDPLPINFVLDKRLWIRWFPQPRFCGRCRNLEFTITITNVLWAFESAVRWQCTGLQSLHLWSDYSRCCSHVPGAWGIGARAPQVLGNN